MTKYNGDPYWTFAKFDSVSADGQPVKKGDRIFYYPRTRAVYIGQGAEREASSFAAAVQDEAVFQGRDW